MAWPSDGSYTAWSNKYKLTSQASVLTATHSWYFFDLSLMPSSFWSVVQADGDDLRFTQDDGETAANHRLVFIDVGTTSGLVAIAQPHGGSGASSDIDTFCYAGNAGASSTSTSSTFPSTLEALYMLQEEPTSASAILDWSGNARHSTLIAGSMVSGDLVTDGPHSGIKSVDFDSNDRATVPSTIFDDCETAGAYTFSCWYKPSNDVDDYGIFGTAGAQFAVAFKTGGTWYTLESQSRNSGNTAYFTVTGSSDNIAAGVWHRLDVVYNGSTLKGYVNGVQIGSVTATSVRSASLNFYIGYDNLTYARGRLAQLSMRSEALSADQIHTLYENETDNASFWVVTEITGSTDFELDVAVPNAEVTTVAGDVEFGTAFELDSDVPNAEVTTVAGDVEFGTAFEMDVAAVTPPDVVAAAAEYVYTTGLLTGPFTVSQSGTGISWTLGSIATLSTFMTYPSTTKKLRILNPAPTYPPGAVLYGVKILVNHACTDDDDSIKDNTFYLVVGGTPAGTDSPDTDDWLTFSGEYGGISSKFGIPALSIADTESPNFGIEFDVVKTANNGLFGVPQVGSSVSFEFFYTIGPVTAPTQKFLPFYH